MVRYWGHPNPSPRPRANATIEKQTRDQTNRRKDTVRRGCFSAMVRERLLVLAHLFDVHISSSSRSLSLSSIINPLALLEERWPNILEPW